MADEKNTNQNTNNANKEYDVTNLTLEDNSFKLLEEGAYHFRVESHSSSYYSGKSSKIPENTQVFETHLLIPFTDESGNISTANVRNNLNIYAKALFAVRQFAECIGLCPESGRANINLEQMDGKDGICEIVQTESNGKTYNNVKMCYPPSKAPKVTLNDTEWEKWSSDDFMEVSGSEELPFND